MVSAGHWARKVEREGRVISVLVRSDRDGESKSPLAGDLYSNPSSAGCWGLRYWDVGEKVRRLSGIARRPREIPI